MDISEIKEYLVDFQKKRLPELIERELEISKTKKIISIIGPRRAGKTYFLYQKMKELINSGIKKENIVYFNFEDPLLIDVNFKDIKEIIKLHWQLYPDSTKEKLYVFVDEPQNVKRWEIAIRRLYEEGFEVFLSGSSSKLLSKEIATSLRGRTLAYTLLPFSFREFLKMKNKQFEFSKLSSREKSLLLNLLDEYLEFGGFAEVIIEEDKQNKIRIINEYFNLVVYRDLIDRYKIRNTKIIKWLIKSLSSSFSKESSVHKIYKTMKSKGLKVSKNTLYTYVSILEDSFFAFFVPKFSYSVRKGEFSISKSYLCDIGFANLVELAKNKGRKMENVVFLELERRRSPKEEIFYWKNQRHEEVDFVLKNGGKVKQLIQVCYDIDNVDTKKREIKSLIKASNELKCNDLVIITESKKGEEKMNRKKIKYIPLLEWSLKR